MSLGHQEGQAEPAGALGAGRSSWLLTRAALGVAMRRQPPAPGREQRPGRRVRYRHESDAGQTVNIALVDGERDETGLLDKEAEIEAATGINLELTTMALGDLAVDSNNQNLAGARIGRSTSCTCSASRSPGPSARACSSALNAYVDGPGEDAGRLRLRRLPGRRSSSTRATSTSPPASSAATTCTSIPGIHSGSVHALLSQGPARGGRRRPCRRHGTEYLAAAKALTTRRRLRQRHGRRRTTSPLFLVDWYTRFITMGGELTSGNKNDGTLRTNLDSPEGDRAPSRT